MLVQILYLSISDPIFIIKAVKRVIEKLPILFNGVQIGIEVFLPDEIIEDVSEEAGEDSENIRGVEVRGVSSKTSEDTVMMYFENTRRSGGGDIKSMKSEDGVFYIIFEDEQGNCFGIFIYINLCYSILVCLTD